MLLVAVMFSGSALSLSLSLSLPPPPLFLSLSISPCFIFLGFYVFEMPGRLKTGHFPHLEAQVEKES